MSIMNTSLSTSRQAGFGVRRIVGSLVACIAIGVVTSVVAPPASAEINQVCRVQATFRIGGDDVRGNTTIQIAAGGEHFTVTGGIPSNSIATRTGRLSRCITHQALTGGFTITSISNPTWPETTDNWDMMGLSLIDPDTGRGYFRQFGFLMHRFTGERPIFQTPGIFVREQEPFFDHRHADCSGNQMFARFVDPLRLNDPQFINVQMRRFGTNTPVVSGSFDPAFRDWGGSLAGLGISDARTASIAFSARTPSGAVVMGAIKSGCNPNSLF